MKKSMQNFTEQLAAVVKVGHQVARIEIEQDEILGVSVYAMTEDNSVLAACVIENPACPIDKIRDSFSVLAGVVIGGERAIKEINA